MKKRVMSGLLVLSLLAGLLPTFSQSARADDTGDKTIMLGVSGLGSYQDNDSAYDYVYFGNYQQDFVDSYNPTVKPETGIKGVDWVSAKNNNTDLAASGATCYYAISPIKWRVLDEDNNYSGESSSPTSGLFLLSENNLDYQQYRNMDIEEDGPEWPNSSLCKWLNGTFYNSAFSGNAENGSPTLEKSAIATSYIEYANHPKYHKDEYQYGYSKIFVPSLAEVTNETYGFQAYNKDLAENHQPTDYNREPGSTDYVHSAYPDMDYYTLDGWWLRSPTAEKGTTGAVGWGCYGFMYSFGYQSYMAIRPALNLDNNKILFTSAAKNGKIAGNTGSLTTVENYTGNEWKITLQDESRNFSVSSSSPFSVEAGGTTQISYSGAGTGDNEYVSVLLCDTSDNVLYYGHIAQNSASGTANLSIPAGLTAGEYKLKVFSEQCNGDYKTDYASAFTDISLTVTDDKTAPELSDGSSTRDSATSATVTFTSNEAGTYYYIVQEQSESAPSLESVVNTGTSGTCAATKNTISLNNLSGNSAKNIYIVVKDAAGNVSNMLTIAMPAYTEKPAITTQPNAQTVTVGATATFSVAASGVPDPGYQWQVSTDNGSTWTPISGATSASYTIEATTLEMNGYQYQCVVSNSAGSATSNAVTLTVQSNDASVTAVSVNGTSGARSEDGTSFTIVLPYGSSLPTGGSAFSISSTDDGATTSTPTTDDEGKTWTFTVTAEDGTTQQTYTIYVSIAADPAAGNKADVAAAKSAIENRSWTVAQSTANTEDTVKAWIENELNGMNLNGVNYSVAVNEFTAATAGTSGDRDGTNGSFAFSVSLSKGENTGETATSTYASDTANANGVITATAYVPPSTPSTPTPPSKPEQPSGPSTGDSDGWESILEEILDAEDGDTITIDMNGETEVPGEIFEAVADRDVTVIFEMGEDVSWTVNGNDVPKDTSFDTLNLGVTMNTSGIPIDVINAITGEVGTVQVTLEHDGAFGFVLTLSASLGEENAGYWANLYHYNEADETMDFETASLIEDDGTVRLRMSHASQYAIVIDDHSHAPLPFVDVSADDWFYDPVVWAYNEGLMTGTSATTFEPDTSTTRGMIVAILHRLEGGPSASASHFTDVASGDWYADAVNWAASVGIVAGFEDGSFHPNDAITREQMAAILCNYAQWKDMDTSACADLSSYSDQPSAWAQDVMEWAVGEGLISGTSATTLDPQGNATRAQVAAILQRFLAE